MKATGIIQLLNEAHGKLSPEQLKAKAQEVVQQIAKVAGSPDAKLDALVQWMEEKPFVQGDIDGIGDFYKEVSAGKRLPDWDQAVSIAFNESHISNKILSSITEDHSDLEKVRAEIAKIQDELERVKVQTKKEREAGKGDNILSGLKKKWQDLQAKIVNIWKDYDKKHGTKYAKAYEA